MMHVERIFRGLTLMTTLAALSGCGGQAGPIESAAKDEAGVVQVLVAPPQRKTLQLATTQPGRVEAFEETPLHAKIAGFVDEVLVDIGDSVERDQVLIRLSIPELADELAQKEALVVQAEAEVEQAASTVVAMQAAAQTAQSKIAEAEAGVVRAGAECDRWQSEYERIKELAAEGSVTKKLEDETYSQLKSAEAGKREVQAKADSANAAYQEAVANVGKAEADKKAAAARLRVAEAELAKAKTMLAYTEIKAPYAGTVTRRNVDTGHFLQPARDPGAQPLMVVAKTDVVRVFVDVPEMEAPYVDVGNAAKVRVQAIAGTEFDARVVRSSWSLLETNHSLRAEIDVPNPRGVLRPGMYAVATIQLAESADTLVVPKDAILRADGVTACMVVQDGQVTRKDVKLGLRSGAEVEIAEGLEEADLVVQKQPDVLKAGQTVSVAAPTN